jgi:hypothetical protein
LHSVGIHLITYLLGATTDFSTQYLNSTNELLGNQMWTFAQHPVYLKNSATREGFANWLSLAGGFMGIVIRFS